jgi:diguanylate cyclase (GGDEF)-like protein
MRALLVYLVVGVVTVGLLFSWVYRESAARHLHVLLHSGRVFLSTPSDSSVPPAKGVHSAWVLDGSGRPVFASRRGVLVEGLARAVLKRVQASHGRSFLLSFRHGDVNNHYLVSASRGNGPVRISVTDVTAEMARIGQTQLMLALLTMLVAGLIAALVYFKVWRIRQRYLGDRQGFLERIDQLLFRASHDDLTGLPNHTLMIETLAKSMSRSRRQNLLTAVLSISVSGLHEVGEQCGIRGAEQILKTLAGRMLGVLREEDMLCRYCGNEFLLMLDSISRVDQATSIAERLFSLCIEPVSHSGREYKVSMNIGISCYPFSDVDAEGLVGEARMAMNRSVEFGHSNYRYYSDEMQTEVARRLFVTSGMEAAMKSGELELYYQPKIHLSSWEMKGVEALLRWRHPEKGMVSPVEFIPVIEQSNLIIIVGEWVLREACRTLLEWKQQNREQLCVAINVSPRQFMDPDFVSRFIHIVAEEGCEPSDFELEITEGSLIEDVNESIGILTGLKQAGFRVAIDDFGTGYSSLSYLQKFPIDTLKIDRAFVKDLHINKDSAAIVTTIMGLSHNLRMDVVAEGVEEIEQLTFLNALGCRNIQGFLFSKPLCKADLFSVDQQSWQMKMQTG